MKDTIGLAFASFICLVTTFLWIWIVFKNGAEAWKNSIIKWDTILRKKTREDEFMLKPVVLKSVISILFAFSLFFFYAALKSVLD